jgi:hypothetical protein
MPASVSTNTSAASPAVARAVSAPTVPVVSATGWPVSRWKVSASSPTMRRIALALSTRTGNATRCTPFRADRGYATVPSSPASRLAPALPALPGAAEDAIFPPPAFPVV